MAVYLYTAKWGAIWPLWHVLVPHPLILLRSYHHLQKIKGPGFWRYFTQVCYVFLSLKKVSSRNWAAERIRQNTRKTHWHSVQAPRNFKLWHLLLFITKKNPSPTPWGAPCTLRANFQANMKNAQKTRLYWIWSKFSIFWPPKNRGPLFLPYDYRIWAKWKGGVRGHVRAAGPRHLTWPNANRETLLTLTGANT